MLKLLPNMFRVMTWSARNPATLGHARMLLWLWSVASLSAIISLGTDIIDGRPTWWWLPIQAALLVLDVTMARVSLLGYLQAREARDTDRHLVPKLEQSAVTFSMVPRGDADVKYAVELGLSIMMDKPIVLLVQPGAKLPSRLVRVADDIVEIDITVRVLPGAIRRGTRRVPEIYTSSRVTWGHGTDQARDALSQQARSGRTHRRET